MSKQKQTIMSKDLVILETEELNLIEVSKAATIKKTFEPMVKMLEQYEDNFNDIIEKSAIEITKDVTVDAKRLRLDISKIRIDAEKVRKEQKEEYLRAGKAIDGVSNILKWAITDKENKLKEIENYFEIQEQNRLKELQLVRAEKLSKYVDDANERDLVKFEEDEFTALLSIKKAEFEDRIAAEKKAEADRIQKEKDEAIERERIRKENEQLKKEAEEREKLAKIEADKRAKLEQERKNKEEAERKLREEKEKKERSEYEAKLKAEKESREKAERKLLAESEAKQKEKERKEAEIQAELNKGDSAKVKDLLNDLEMIKTKYSFKSAKNSKMYSDVNQLIDKILHHIKKQ